MGLSAVASGLAFVYVVMHYLFTMNAFEPLFWTGCAYVVVRIVKTGDQRLWLAFGAIAGLGLQNKYSMGVFAFALVVGVLLSPARRAFAKPWIWLGGALAFLIFLPNVIWNVQHGWPFFELMRNIRASGRDVVLGPVAYVLRQVLNMNPANLPIWLVGLGWLLFSARGRAFRPLGWAFLVTLATFIATKGKDYYLAPAFATLFAAGATGIEGFTASGRRRWLRPAVVALQVPLLLYLPLGLPILPVDALLTYQERLGMTLPATEKAHARAALPHHFAWQFGWDEMVATVAARVPRDAARGAGAGRDHRQRLRPVRGRRPPRTEVRPADESPRHAPELLALGARRRLEERLHRPRRPARGAPEMVRERRGRRGAEPPVDRRLGRQARARLPRAALPAP